MKKYFLPAFLVFLMCQAMFSQTTGQILNDISLSLNSTPQPGQKYFSNANSILQLRLDPACQRFWKGNDWDSIYVLKKEHALRMVFDPVAKTVYGIKNIPYNIYLPALQNSLFSTQINSWQTDSQADYEISSAIAPADSKIRDGLLSSQKSARLAKASYGKAFHLFGPLSNYSQKYSNSQENSSFSFDKFYSKLLGYLLLEDPAESFAFAVNPIHSIFLTAFLSIPDLNLYFIDIAMNVPGAFEYSSHWQDTMNYEADALQSSADATNLIFAKAQGSAERLKKMGAGEEVYSGNAKSAYEKWEQFVFLSSKYSDPSSPLPPSGGASENYARAYHTLSIYSAVCENPGHLPLFDGGGANLSEAFNLMSNAGEGSLPYAGLEFSTSLSWAEQAMLNEVEANKTDVFSLSQEVRTLKKQIDSNDPSLFAQWDEFDNSPAPYLKPAPVSGTIDQLYSSFTSYSASGEGEFSAAQEYYAKRGENSGSAFAILHYSNSSYYYLLAKQTALKLNSTMLEKSQKACNSANEKLIQLKAKLGGPSGLSDADLLANSYALQSLISSNESYMRSLQEDSYGKQYSLCMDSLSNSNKGLENLGSGSKFKKDADVSKALQTYLEFIDAGRAMGEDVFSYEANYNLTSSLYQQGFFVSSEQVNLQTSSLHHLLSSHLAAQNEKYLYLRLQAEAIGKSDPQTLPKFDSFFSKYRDNDLWSLQALKEYSSLDAYLSSQGAVLSPLLEKAIEKDMCKNLQWLPKDNSIPISLSRRENGGKLILQNSLGIEYHKQIIVSCPFSIPFQFADIISHSENIENAYCANGQISILFNSITAFGSPELEFSSPSVPFRHRQLACKLSVSPSGKLSYDANYSLSSDFASPLVRADISWSSGGESGQALLVTPLFEQIGGRWDSNEDGSGKISFDIPGVKKGEGFFEVKIIPDSYIALQKQNYLVSPSSSAGKLLVSYTLLLENLPSCAQGKISVEEEGAGSITGLKIISDSAQISSIKPSLGGGGWSADAKSLSGDGRLALSISYEIENASKWLESSLFLLRAKAQSYNDSVSLSMADSAQEAFLLGKPDMAYKLVSDLQTRLSAQSFDDGASLSSWEEESGKGDDLVSYLSNLSSTIGIDENISLKYELNFWSTSLSNSLSDSKALAQKGQISDAKIKWRNALSKLSPEAAQKANSEYNSLMQTQSELSGAIQALPSLSASISYESSSLLSDAKEQLQNENPFYSLSSLVEAQRKLAIAYPVAFEAAKEKFGEQNSKKAELGLKYSAFSDSLKSYSDLLASLASSGAATQPSLSSQEAQAMEKSIKSPFSYWKDSMPPSLDKSVQAINERESLLAGSQANITYAQGRIDAGYSSLEQSATNLRRTAYLSIEQLRSKTPSSPALSTLDDDMKSLDGLIGDKKWPDAIFLAESIITRTSKLMPAASASDPPYIPIALTILLLAGAAYVLFFRKGEGNEKGEGEKKILQKSENTCQSGIQ